MKKNMDTKPYATVEKWVWMHEDGTLMMKLSHESSVVRITMEFLADVLVTMNPEFAETFLCNIGKSLKDREGIIQVLKERLTGKPNG